MTNTKHDEEIKELLDYMLKLKNEAKMILPKFLNSDLHDSRQKYCETLKSLITNNNNLVNVNKWLHSVVAKLDTDINDAHKDLVEVHDILAYGNSCGFEEDIAAALRITVKYID